MKPIDLCIESLPIKFCIISVPIIVYVITSVVPKKKQWNRYWNDTKVAAIQYLIRSPINGAIPRWTCAMQKHYFIVGPSTLCPFRVGALKYTPARSMDNSYTLTLLHAMNLHKETFDSFLSAFLGDTQNSSLPIKDVWCIGMPLDYDRCSKCFGLMLCFFR